MSGCSVSSTACGFASSLRHQNILPKSGVMDSDFARSQYRSLSKIADRERAYRMRWMRVFCAAVLGGLAGAGSVCHSQGDPARSFDPQTAAARKPGTIVRVDLIGDSTQTDNAGYGR